MDTHDKHEPKTGNVYEDDRNELLMQALYVGQQIVVLRLNEENKHNDGYIHRLERRSSFDSNVNAGRYKFKPDSSLDLFSEQTVIDWTDVTYVGEKANENLHKSGYKTYSDILNADVDTLTNVGGIGTVAAENIIEDAQSQ